MNRFLKGPHGPYPKTVSFFSNLTDLCLSLESSDFAKFIHGQLMKVGFNSHTYLGNRFIDLYSKFGFITDALQAFDDITKKNIISWNICLRVYVKSGDLENACILFDNMPERDIVTWNSMIYGFSSNGFLESALHMFRDMHDAGMRPNEYTFSVLASSVKSSHHGRQIHGRLLRCRLNWLNLVVGNSLIDMYGTIGLVDYAFGVFLTMEGIDIISWNSLISSCCKMGYLNLGLNQFCLMISHGFSPDQFTISTLTTVCSSLQDLERGKQIFALSIKLGLLSNTIVSSATIDMFSKCNRLEDAIQLFEEMNTYDNIVCNSMISSYARHGFGQEALQVFLLALRDNLRPTEFTISTVLSAASSLVLAEPGFQIHSLVLKLAMESDMVVASSLLEMYAKFGLIDSSKEIFGKMNVKDLISWNTMILGFAQNGRLDEALELFDELLKKGPPPDHITLLGVLLACSHGGFLDEGLSIFSLMEKAYGVLPKDEHYLCLVDMMIRAGKLREALDITESMPYEPSPLFWESLLCGYGAEGNMKIMERIAERFIEFRPRAALPYLVLGRAYELRGRWESMVRVKKAMKEGSVKTVIGCSWIGIRNHIFAFKSNHIFRHEDRDIYLMLKLLVWEMSTETCAHDQYDDASIGAAQE